MFLSSKKRSEIKKKTTEGYEKKIKKTNEVLERQRKTLQELQQSIDDNPKKGELIYEKYAVIDEILKEINKARKKYSWKDIKKKLKGHKIIKDINEKEGKIIVEL